MIRAHDLGSLVYRTYRPSLAAASRGDFRLGLPPCCMRGHATDRRWRPDPVHPALDERLGIRFDEGSALREHEPHL
jgi:hypothetical protein